MRAYFVAAALLLATPAAHAQDSTFELRGGPAFHGLELTSKGILNPFANGSRIEDLKVELIYTPPIDLSLLGSPRLAVGATINFRGYENMIHANANWHLPLFSGPVFVEGELGAAYVTGYLQNPPHGFRALGCHAMFYFGVGVGVELPGDWTATLSEEHSSHAWLCGPTNGGLNSIALSLGRKF